MSKDDKHKDKKDREAEREAKLEEQHRQLQPTPEDRALFGFLEALFQVQERSTAPGVPGGEVDCFPDRIVLRTCHGTAGRDLGPVIHQEEYKPTMSRAPGRERLVALSNTLLAKARHDCQELGKKQRYVVLAYSTFKGANSYARHLMALAPGAREYEEKNAVPDEEDSGEDGTTVKGLLKELYRDRRFQQDNAVRLFEVYSSAVEGLFARFDARLAAAENANTELIRVHAQMIQLREETLDRRANRELRQQKEAFWQAKTEKAIELAEGIIVPAIQAKLIGPQAAAAMALRTFAASLDEAQKIALFGEWEGEQQTKKGMLTQDQCAIFDSLIQGAAPAAIQAFITTLSPEQLAKAQKILRQEQLAVLMSVATSANANGAS